MSESASRMSLGHTAFELQLIWREGAQTCPVCVFVIRRVEQYIDSLFYEKVNDPQTRDAVRAAGGFCRYHAGMISTQADALGTAIILEDVLRTDLRSLDAGAYDRPSAPGSALARFFERGSQTDSTRREIQCLPCSICKVEQGMEELAVDGFLEGLANPDFSALFRQSPGLCMPHFRLAFERASDGEQWAVVVETQRSAVQKLTNQLTELARKHDYRFRDEPRGDEMSSWRQALNATSSWVRK